MRARKAWNPNHTLTKWKRGEERANARKGSERENKKKEEVRSGSGKLYGCKRYMNHENANSNSNCISDTLFDQSYSDSFRLDFKRYTPKKKEMYTKNTHKFY